MLLFFNIVFANGYKEFIDLLEAGKHNVVEEKINKLKDEYNKRLLTAIRKFYLGDYEFAFEEIKNLSAVKWDRETEYIVENIKAVNEIITNKYEKFESEHFIVFLKGKDIILKEKILSELEKIYSFYQKIFNFYIDEKVRVEVYNSKQEFYVASTLGEEIVNRSGVVGICKFNRIMILSPENLPYGYRWVDTLAHEYLHFILNRITEYKLPLYLHEATARYFDTMYRSTNSLCLNISDRVLLLKAKQENKIIPFDSFRGSLAYLSSQEEVGLAFSELSSFVEYVVKLYGVEKYVNFLREYKNYNIQKKENEEKFYLEYFGEKMDLLFSKWLDHIEQDKELYNKYKGVKYGIKFFSEDDEKNLIGLEIEEYVRLADKYYKNKNKKMAVYYYNKALDVEPYNPVAMARIAKAYYEMGNLEQAKSLLSECISVNPNYVYAYELLFEVVYLESDFDRIEQIYHAIMDINPFNYKIRKKYAEMLSDLGKTKPALKEYEIVSILNPADLEVIEIMKSLGEYLKMKEKIK